MLQAVFCGAGRCVLHLLAAIQGIGSNLTCQRIDCVPVRVLDIEVLG